MSLDDLIAADKPTRKERPSRQPRERKPAAMEVEKTILKPRQRSRSPARGAGRRIVKVSNMPAGLTWQELKDAFSSVGPVERADVDGNVGIIIFRNSADAKEAIRVYDGGVMNGRKIAASYA